MPLAPALHLCHGLPTLSLLQIPSRKQTNASPLTYKFSSMKISVCLQKQFLLILKFLTWEKTRAVTAPIISISYPLQNSEDVVASLFFCHFSTGVSRIAALHWQNAHNNFTGTENPIKLSKQTTQQQWYYNPKTSFLGKPTCHIITQMTYHHWVLLEEVIPGLVSPVLHSSSSYTTALKP